jgi:ABC-2 type transport system permease protein
MSVVEGSPPMKPTRLVRMVFLAWWLRLKMMSRSPFQVILIAVWPLVFATTALLMYRVRGNSDDLAYAALGSSVMAIWSTVGSLASGVLQSERGHGTLELLAVAPVSLAVVIFPITMAASTIGLYGMVAALVWARVLFGVEISVAAPLSFAAAIVLVVVAVAALGFVLSVTIVRYRASWALGNALEYPVWLLCGLLAPVSSLPGWVRPISWLLAPTWGMQAIRHAAKGEAALGALVACAGLSVAYLLLGAGLAETVLRSARRHATLTLT